MRPQLKAREPEGAFTQVHRRHFLASLTALGASGCWFRPGQGLLNPCLNPQPPDKLKSHELAQQAFADLRPEYLWDDHVHLLGVGDSGSGIWINPAMQSLAHPVQYTQFRFYLNASCAEKDRADHSFLSRLLALKQAFPVASRFMLLAFDHSYDKSGQRRPDLSAFHVPNEFAARLHREYPEHFEWIASIHPYRKDALEALTRAAKSGARAVKWLPPAMGMDPGAVLCDGFYEALARLDLPLLVHAGDEKAVHGSGKQEFGNPLLLRRPLDHGVRVIVAHCASLGQGRDLDKGPGGPWLSNFSLFKRLLNEARYEGRLFGEISAVTQRNRAKGILTELIETDAWHSRLVNGSDYPLPGVMPLFSLRKLRREKFITTAEASALTEVRRHNAILFDFMLKRLLRSGNKRFSPSVFESRRIYGQPEELPGTQPQPQQGAG